MGSKFSKWKCGKKAQNSTKNTKKQAANNTPRSAGSTQSLNIEDNVGSTRSISTQHNVKSISHHTKFMANSFQSLNAIYNAQSTQSLNNPGFEDVPSYPGSSCQLNDAPTPAQKQLAEAPKVEERPAETPLTRTISVPVQMENKQCMSESQSASLLRRIRGKTNTESIYYSPETTWKPKMEATMNYDAKSECELNLKKGDIMQLIDDEENDEWYSVRHITTAKEGRVPRNCVAKITNFDVESQTYFFQLDRIEAEEKLLKQEIGTYLIRRSEEPGDVYALSLHCKNEMYEPQIRHYKIKFADRGVCYIEGATHIKPFGNIVELIKYYSEEQGLRCKLKEPLPQNSPLSRLSVTISDFSLGQELGSGNYGTVYAGILKSKSVAVKCLRAGCSMTVEDFRMEAEAMHRLRHPSLVSLLAISEHNDKLYIITERMSKGALLTLLRADTDQTIKFTDLMEMAIQVTEGMCYLEKKNFVHRDLRAANILVGDGNLIKIADFGLARLLDNYYGQEHHYMSRRGAAFPYKWTAPEAIRKLRFTVKSDVWSFGILLYEMVTYGDEPYAAMNNTEVLTWLEKGNRLPRPTDYYKCPLALYNIMKSCWLINAGERPNFADLEESLLEIESNAWNLYDRITTSTTL